MATSLSTFRQRAFSGAGTRFSRILPLCVGPLGRMIAGILWQTELTVQICSK